MGKTVQTLNASWNWVDFSEQRPKTTICDYEEGHDVQSHECTDYSKSPYNKKLLDLTLLDRVKHCCVKDGYSIIHLSMRQGHTTKLLTAIAKTASTNKVLTELHVDHFYLSDEEALAIKNCLVVKTLKELHICECEFVDQSLKIVLQAVEWNPVLTKLNISNVILSDDDIHLISVCLNNNEELHELILIGIKMTDSGVKSVSHSLRNNRTLKLPNIADNTITNKGATEIADAIKSNTTLLNLNI